MAKGRQTSNARVQHGDRRQKQGRKQYGALADLTVPELQQRAQRKGIKGRSGMRKAELIKSLSR